MCSGAFIANVRPEVKRESVLGYGDGGRSLLRTSSISVALGMVAI